MRGALEVEVTRAGVCWIMVVLLVLGLHAKP